jgi:hypothetical protein
MKTIHRAPRTLAILMTSFLLALVFTLTMAGPAPAQPGGGQAGATELQRPFDTQELRIMRTDGQNIYLDVTEAAMTITATTIVKSSLGIPTVLAGVNTPFDAVVTFYLPLEEGGRPEVIEMQILEEQPK